MSKHFNELNKELEKAAVYTAILNLIDYDSQVNAPPESDRNTSQITGVIANEYHDIFTGKRFIRLLKKCKKEAKNKELTTVESALVREAAKKSAELVPIPSDEYRDFSELTARSVNIWTSAKKHDSYEEFAPQLEKIINYKKKFAAYQRRGEKNLYDVLLKAYEPEFLTEELDVICRQVKDAVIPLVKDAVKRQKKDDKDYSWSCMDKGYDVKKLDDFCMRLGEYIGLESRKCVIGESEHPFTINVHNRDVRLTNNYRNRDIFGPIFSMLHESGHALYELGIADKLSLTILGTGTSMGMHEAQSRFFENMIGKQRSFWEVWFPRLKETFPKELSGIQLDDFMQAINRVSQGVIRIDADELTYPLHIIIRYELEKKLISGKIKAGELEKEWNHMYKDYIGITPSDASEGVLQDIHWAMGEFGYFPSYLIGSAAAAQIYYHIQEKMPEAGINEIRNYLRENIYVYGKTLGMNRILKKMMSEEFNINYYIQYLKDKWG